MAGIFGWSYPPGVTAADIERAVGADYDCDPDADDCRHGEHCFDCCPECQSEYDQALMEDAAERRGDAMRDGDY